MIRVENECVGCPPERGCIGNACPYLNVTRCYCDVCGEEIGWNDPRFDVESDYHLCENCEPEEEEEEE